MGDLKNMLIKNEINENAKAVFISIGVNDNYIDYGVVEIIKLIHHKFPQAYLFIISGSYGWGNAQLSRKLAVNYINYYKKWRDNGVYVLNNLIGYGDPHNNKIEYSKVGKEINSIIQLIK